jgi:catechol 2,3-dioxygenase-like lactoylglutathione lyase family enzyme
MILTAHHIGISTPDRSRLEKFYCEQFGFERISEFSWDIDNRNAAEILKVDESAGSATIIQHGQLFLELLQFETPEITARSSERHVTEFGISHLCFQVDDCWGEFDRLKKSGMEFHCDPKADASGGVFVYGRDPDGNVLELWQISSSERISLSS